MREEEQGVKIMVKQEAMRKKDKKGEEIVLKWKGE